MIKTCVDIASTLASHLMLVPAFCCIAIMTICYYRHSKQWSLLIPFDFLGKSERYSILIFSFGCMANALITDVFWRYLVLGNVNWLLKPFAAIFAGIEVGVVYYPIFVCRNATESPLITTTIGFIYTLLLIVRRFLDIFAWNCLVSPNLTSTYHILMFLPEITCLFVVLFCYAKKLIKFLMQRGTNYKEHSEIACSDDIEHVGKIFINNTDDVVIPAERQSWKNYLRETFFHVRYSSLLFSLLPILSIFYYQFVVLTYYVMSLIKPTGYNAGFFRTGMIIFLLFTSCQYAQFMHFMVCHRKNLLNIWKYGLNDSSDKSIYGMFDNTKKTTFILYRHLTLAGTLMGLLITIAFLLPFGTVIVSYLIVELFAILGYEAILKTVYLLLVISILMLVIDSLLVKFLCCEKSSPTVEGFGTIRNTKAYHIAFYFTYFGNAWIGFCSAVLRIAVIWVVTVCLKSSRIDVCAVEYRYCLLYDHVYELYLSYLKITAIYENPTMHTFCQILLEQKQKRFLLTRKLKQPRVSRKSLNRWQLAVFLIKNPTLQRYRIKCVPSVTAPSVTEYQSGDSSETTI